MNNVLYNWDISVAQGLFVVFGIGPISLSKEVFNLLGLSECSRMAILVCLCLCVCVCWMSTDPLLALENSDTPPPSPAPCTGADRLVPNSGGGKVASGYVTLAHSSRVISHSTAQLQQSVQEGSFHAVPWG